ncbi:WD REPEATS REGION domain-containing protein [Citrus sinensis]|uniref:WD REPEATS REGION domain-containing protein n=1 Tax=Citrus sinensis TaxID=2711 RepID=A0ACB8K8U5_CITSI|nr:WD REPEATS REGION domain-containing protein [Citrus sinensis]
MEVGISFRDYNGRISSMDFHKSSSYLVTASDDESIRPYDCLISAFMDITFWITKPLVVLFDTFIYSESLRFLSLHDNKYLRYFKGHHDSLCSSKDCFISGSLDQTVLLWDQRAEKSYDDQGLVFAVAFGGYIRMFDARKYEKGPFDIFSDGEDVSDSDVIKFSNDGRIMLPTTMEGHIRVLDSFKLMRTYFHLVVLINENKSMKCSKSKCTHTCSDDGSGYAWSVRSGKGSPVIKWAPGSLMFVTGSSELSFWNPNVSKLGAYFGRK